MSGDRSYGEKNFRDVNIPTTDPHSAYRSPWDSQYRKVRIPVERKKKGAIYRWFLKLFDVF